MFTSVLISFFSLQALAAAGVAPAVSRGPRALDQLYASAGGPFAAVADGGVSADDGVEVVREEKGVRLGVRSFPDETIATYADRQTLRITDRAQFRSKAAGQGEWIGQLIGGGAGLAGGLSLRESLSPHVSGSVSLWAVYAMFALAGAVAGAIAGGWLAGNISDTVPDEFTRDVNARSVRTRQ